MASKKFKRTLSVIALVLIFAMVLGTVASALTGCGKAEETSEAAPEATQEQTQEQVQVQEQAQAQDKEENSTPVVLRVAGLKGATTIGLLNFIKDVEAGNTDIDVEFTMYTAGSDIMAAFVAGDLDIGLVPSNVAAVMNNKVEGGVSVIDINTLGVLGCVSGDDSINSVKDLSGRTVYMTGQGATPEYTVRYLLEQSGVTDCDLQFKSEPTEIVSIFAEDKDAVAILPQPFTTAALSQNENLKIAFLLDDEWEKYNTDCRIVTGVTVASNSFIAEHKDIVDEFIKLHSESAKKALEDVDGTAALAVEKGIIAKEPLAKKAIPNCSIVCVSGSQIKDMLEGYLKVLYDQDPKSVGGALPEESFYYN